MLRQNEYGKAESSLWDERYVAYQGPSGSRVGRRQRSCLHPCCPTCWRGGPGVPSHQAQPRAPTCTAAIFPKSCSTLQKAFMYYPLISAAAAAAAAAAPAETGQGHLKHWENMHRLKTAGGARACLETLELRGWSSKRGGGMWGCPAEGPLGALCPFTCAPFADSSSDGGPGKRGVASAPTLPRPVQ